MGEQVIGDTGEDGVARAGLAGLVLAGGGSTRFGSDKALAVVDGLTLLDRAVACLRAACDGPVLVASGDGTSRPGVADGQVAEVVAGAGPLSAIAAGLEALRPSAHAVAVLAVDHIAPSPELLRLLAGRRGDADCALASVGRRRQPLHAVWSTRAAEALDADVRAGTRGVLAWLAGRDVVVLGEAELLDADVPLAAVRDADQPQDLPT
jgi:molybdopterin-guanine dinucleotide biosynthesis protein A